MTIADLATWIRKNRKNLNNPPIDYGDVFVVCQHTRDAMREDVHITDAHIFECCEKANSFEEHVALCRPLARIDTEKFHIERLKPAPKGRTKRRFR